MSPRLLILAIAPLLATATAHAQAPGEMEPSAPQPMVQDPSYGAAASSVMSRRWAVGLSIGTLDLAPENNPEAKSQFATAQLSFRYRATRNLELELALAGGAQKYEDGSDGSLAMNSGTLGARYRFSPEAKWSWWLMAGLGATVVADKYSTQEERDQLTRPHGTIGIGIERRWNRFAIQAELRGVRVGETQNEMNGYPAVDGGPSTGTGGGEPPPEMKPTLDPIPPDYYGPQTTLAGPQIGGALSIGASFYF